MQQTHNPAIQAIQSEIDRVLLRVHGVTRVARSTITSGTAVWDRIGFVGAVRMGVDKITIVMSSCRPDSGHQTTIAGFVVAKTLTISYSDPNFLNFISRLFERNVIP